MNRRAKGSCYERQAGRYLEDKGYRILQYNYRCRIGEIDIVAQDGQTLVFCEVKYRGTLHYGSPLSAVGRQKQRTIARCAGYYLMENRIGECPCRFDVIGISPEEVRHVENAFEA